MGATLRLLSRTILLNDVSHAVIGVLPPGFEFLPFQDTDVIVPVPERTCRSCGYIRAVARLKAGVPATVAQQELDAIAAGLANAFPDSNEGRGVNVGLILLGAGIGVAGSLALTRVIAGFLFGITPTDAPTLLAVLLLFGAVAFLSTYIPARRASRIDPAAAFRYE